jgi:hypothetical protein
MRPLSLLIALPLVFAGPLHAQRAETRTFAVGGRVLDAATLEPIPDAVVRLTDTDVLAVTDSSGRFLLRGVPTGTHSWRISRIGYAAWYGINPPGPRQDGPGCRRCWCGRPR